MLTQPNYQFSEIVSRNQTKKNIFGYTVEVSTLVRNGRARGQHTQNVQTMNFG